MGKKSRDKGKRGERAVVHLFERHGYVAHRTAQVDGSLSSDVVADEFPEFHIEVKWHARIGIFRFWEQCERDRGLAQDPVLFVKEDGSPWLVCVSPGFFFSCLGAPPSRTGGTPS